MKKHTSLFILIFLPIFSLFSRADIMPPYELPPAPDIRTLGIDNVRVHISTRVHERSFRLGSPFIVNLRCQRQQSLFEKISNWMSGNVDIDTWEYVFVCPADKYRVCPRDIPMADLNNLMDNPTCTAEVLTPKTRYNLSNYAYQEDENSSDNFPVNFPFFHYNKGGYKMIILLLDKGQESSLSNEDQVLVEQTINDYFVVHPELIKNNPDAR